MTYLKDEYTVRYQGKDIGYYITRIIVCIQTGTHVESYIKCIGRDISVHYLAALPYLTRLNGKYRFNKPFGRTTAEPFVAPLHDLFKRDITNNSQHGIVGGIKGLVEFSYHRYRHIGNV